MHILRPLLVSVAVCALAAAASADCVFPYFQTLADIEVPASASLATADLNGDGKPDLIASNETTVIWLRNTGGAFAAPVTLHEGTLSKGVLVADFTGDNKLDVVVAETGPANALVVIPGNGDGTFGAIARTNIGVAPLRIETGDFDEDGRFDVAVLNTTIPALVVYRSTAAGFVERTRATVQAAPLAMHAADLDDDGSLDVIVSSDSSILFEVFYGNGDGSLDPVVQFAAVRSIIDLDAADHNNDGHTDLSWLGQRVLGNTLNIGNRAFGDPLHYTPGQYWATALEIAELTGDGVPDLIDVGDWSGIDTFSGDGSGTFDWAVEWGEWTNNRWPYESVVAADFNGDGRIDVAGGAPSPPSRIVIVSNRCGDVAISATPSAPLVSTGTPFDIHVTINAPAENVMYYYPGVGGVVSIVEGATVLAQKTRTGYTDRMTLTVNNLPAGDHSLVARFSGDAQHEPAETAPVLVKVTSQKTTTTLTLSTTQLQFGQPLSIASTVTSQIAGAITGSIRVIVNGNETSGVTELAAPSGSASRSFALGTYTLVARYSGSTTQPPSASAAQTVTVRKATPRVRISPSAMNAGSDAPIVTVTISNPWNNQPYNEPAPGQVTLSYGDYEETKALTTWSTWQAEFQLPQLPAGRHYLRVRFSGNDSHVPIDVTEPFLVFPPSTSAQLDARGSAAGVTINRAWPVQGYPTLWRRIPGGTPTQICCLYSGGGAMLDQSAQPLVVYLYWAHDQYSNTTSNIDVGMRITFADDGLVAGTRIRSLHMTEIVLAANKLREAAGLTPLTLTFPSTRAIAASDITTLRNAINDARVALGAAPFVFTDVIAPGVTVRALHVQELREAIR